MPVWHVCVTFQFGEGFRFAFFFLFLRPSRDFASVLILVVREASAGEGRRGGEGELNGL